MIKQGPSIKRVDQWSRSTRTTSHTHMHTQKDLARGLKDWRYAIVMYRIAISHRSFVRGDAKEAIDHVIAMRR